MNYRVSMIPYGNMAPYRMLGPPAGCAFVEEFPRLSVGSLKGGSVLASCAPVGGLPALEGTVDYLGAYGIAAAGEVQSVLLLSQVPFGDLSGAHTVWVTDQTASSVRLLCLLLGLRRGFDDLPARAPEQATATAVLLIGDRALLAFAHGGHFEGVSYPFVVDLAAEWYARHRLPFVFARWVVRRDAPAAVCAALAAWLDEFRRREPELVAASVPLESARLGLPLLSVAEYHRGIRRVLTPEDLRGQSVFQEELQRHERALARRCREWTGT